MVECVISLCTPRLIGTWETRCSLSHDTCLDTALVKGATCVRLGEVPNKGRSPVARRIRRRQHVCAISSQPEGVLLKAHNIQILTILRLLECDSGDNARALLEPSFDLDERTAARVHTLIAEGALRRACFSHSCRHRRASPSSPYAHCSAPRYD